MPTVPSTYLPPVVETTTVRRTTIRPRITNTQRIITNPTPNVRISDVVETKEGYVYTTPKISFTLPTKPSERTVPKVETPKPTVPVTYLPPVTARLTTTTRKPTTTTQR